MKVKRRRFIQTLAGTPAIRYPAPSSRTRAKQKLAGSLRHRSIYGERLACYEYHPRIDKHAVRRLSVEYRNSHTELNPAKDAADTLEELFRACHDHPRALHARFRVSFSVT